MCAKIFSRRDEIRESDSDTKRGRDGGGDKDAEQADAAARM